MFFQFNFSFEAIVLKWTATYPKMKLRVKVILELSQKEVVRFLLDSHGRIIVDWFSQIVLNFSLFQFAVYSSQN